MRRPHRSRGGWRRVGWRRAGYRVAHIPHDVEVEIGIVGSGHAVVVIVDLAVVAAESESEIGAEPVTDTEIVGGGDVVFVVAAYGLVGKGHLHACSKLEIPVVAP